MLRGRADSSHLTLKERNSHQRSNKKLLKHREPGMIKANYINLTTANFKSGQQNNKKR